MTTNECLLIVSSTVVLAAKKLIMHVLNFLLVLFISYFHLCIVYADKL